MRLDFDGVGGKSAASWKASRRLLDLNQVRWKALEHADLIGASSEIRDSQKVSCRCAQFHQAKYFAFGSFFTVSRPMHVKRFRLKIHIRFCRAYA